jgi:hypothetical protein
MKRTLIFITLFSFSTTFAGYDCFSANDDGTYNPTPVITIQSLEKDTTVLQDLNQILYIGGESYVKYQYWAEAGDGFHMVSFIGIGRELEEGAWPQIVSKQLFCKDNGAVEEGGLPDDLPVDLFE